MSGKGHGIWIGTSGWVYKEWAGNFYPKGWPKKDEFGFYVRHFPTVEINATFYRLPSLKMVRGWHQRSPEGFRFAVKGSRYLTHIRRLQDTGPGLRKYFSRIKPLAERTGPILWQLPPNFLKNEENWRRLERFLKKLPKRYQHAVEFRHPSWCDEQTHALLRKHRAVNVWISSQKMPADYAITGDFVYLRFHGLEGGAYHDYTDDELQPWAKQLVKAANQGLPAYVYFNNDLNTRAPLNGHALMRLVGEQAVQPLAAAPDEAAPLEIAPPVVGPETWRPWKRRAKANASNGNEGIPSPRSLTRTATKTTGSARKRTRATKKSTAAPRRQRAPRVVLPGREQMRVGSRRFAGAAFASAASSASALPPTH